ncbi:PBSX family phage terminase large subunit [Megasphaera sueciensis]|uniref:PBSX family phage terminase large subunit n=1 Tax=Megasphaera sueciensis TaxID=349094 RepID=UPI003D01FB17
MMNQKSNASFKWQPFSKKQLQVLTWWMDGSPHQHDDMIIADGSIRSGKTVSMIDSFITWSLSKFSGEAFIIAGRSMGALKRNVIRPMQQILASKGFEYYYNRSEGYILIGDNVYYLFGASNESSQDVVQGLTAAGAFCDEAALFPESFIKQVIGRCSVEGSKLWFNCNPESPYHFLKKDYIDKAEEKHVFSLHFLLDDNLTLSQETKDRYRRSYEGLWYQRMILGLWVLAEGIIYDMFHDGLIYTDDDWNNTLKSTCRRYVAMDYGTTNPMVFLDIYDNEEDIYIQKEYYWDSKEKMKQKSDPQYEKDYEEFIGEEEPDAVILDPSAASFRVLLQGSGHRVLEADNSVNDGIRMVSTMMTRKKLHINSRCVNTIRELRTYVWDEKASQHGEEKPLKVNDHACDALRYYVKTMVKDWRINDA